MTRSKCAYCRFKKCLKQGMIIEMIRGPRSNKKYLIEPNQIQKVIILEIFSFLFKYYYEF